LPIDAVEKIVAVDWGTSSFRAWLLGADGEPIAESRSSEGMQAVEQGSFPAVLRRHIETLVGADAGKQTIGVVMCGMVGARQGWQEAPYGALPASAETISAGAVEPEGVPYKTFILPGLANRNEQAPDVMRGEETQLLGLLLERPDVSGIVAMPGTHSKWVLCESGQIRDFSTVMTGELFSLIAKQSIVRHSIGDAKPSGNAQSPAFQDGLSIGISDPDRTIERMFSLRARQLLFGASGEEIADRLSGILIGAEVASQMKRHGRNVELVASGPMEALYSAAVIAAGGTVRVTDADKAVRKGLHHAAEIIFQGSAA
jgi:2-dehydro-3-deoxygalactonokinase